MPAARLARCPGSCIAVRAFPFVPVRVRLSDGLWFVLRPEVGVALVGIDLGVDDRRITAQVGPRIGLHLGFSVAP